jgi:hypothetical protein
MKLPADEIFHEVCADVVVRFKGHDSYKGRSGALRAFRKRAPGYDLPVYESAFDSCCDIYDLAVIAIELFPAAREKTSKYAEFEDIDFARCMQHIECVFPGDGEGIKKQILNWVIFWHYLK